MEKQQVNELVIRDHKIDYRNFSGVATDYNPAGCRNFNLIFPNEEEEMVRRMIEDGWNIKPYRPDDDEPPRWKLRVEAKYTKRDGSPVKRKPRIYTLGRVKTELEKEDLHNLDSADIDRVSLTINPYEWAPGKLKAYVKNLYVYLKMDELEEEFENYGKALNDDEMPFD